MQPMKYVFSLVLSFFLGFSACAQSAEVRKKEYNLEDGLAIEGYDPVAYFTDHKPVKGKKEYAYTYLGVTYYFGSSSHKNLFAGNPAAYEPQYGGWCAYAMGDSGEKVEVDPKTFKILNGKLYLFYNFFFNNTLTEWNEREAVLKNRADQNWSKIVVKK